jgi:hypothetical protein
MQRADVLEWLKIRYEGMRRDPLIKEIYPTIDPAKTFDQLLSENPDRNYAELNFIANYHPKDVQIIPLFYGNDKGAISLESKVEDIKLSKSHVIIVIDFSQINTITNNIKFIVNTIRQLWRIYCNNSQHIKYNTTDYDITYKIGDIVRGLKEKDSKITWLKIAEQCLELRLLKTDIESAERTIRDHYWPRYEEIVFKGGWKHL